MAEAAGRLAGLVRAPALHFLAAGALLFLANGWWERHAPDAAAPDAQEPVVVGAAQIEQLRRDLIVRKGRPPSAPQLAAAVAEVVDEELLYREALAIGLDRDNAALRQRLVQIARFVGADPAADEETLYQRALALGLDRSDPVVRRHLVAKMRLVAASLPLAGETAPDEAELEAYLQRHADTFREPARYRLSHVYLSDDRRGGRAEADARHVRDRLQAEGVPPEAAPGLGDPFLGGHHLPWQTLERLSGSLGAALAREAGGIEPGIWSEPVRSAFGWHLIWVHEVRPAALPPLAAVRDRVLRALLAERRQWRVEQTLAALRARYPVRIEQAELGGSVPARAGADG
ncbi:MAG TPA: peptidyl-prolyl cis-trans isomerase [Geminicoccaceae bacterium]|nr:peptidyl-prolyl cis-trans isomerase [Geminicoccaceae bacterium]